MKMRSFAIDQSLYEVVNSMPSPRFTIRQLRDLFSSRLKDDGIHDVSLAEVRLYVYEHMRRMQKAGWIILDEPKSKRGQVYILKALPENIRLELKPGRFHGFCGEPTAPAEATPEKNQYLHQLRNQLKELELDMLASMGEVERYKLLITEMPEFSNSLEAPLAAAREKSSKLIGHFRAVENTLSLLQASK